MKPQSTELLHSSPDGGEVRGYCNARFARVFDEFCENFTARGEVGASVCVTVEGETVVDLWGGFTSLEKDQAWAHDNVVVVFSATKGATALCAHILASRGMLDLDAPIAEIWPEFACNGKENALVGMTLDHSVGVPALRDKVGDIADWQTMVDHVAREQAFWEPGTLLGYHGLTYSWTIGELIKRAAGKSVGTFFADAVAQPLDLEFWIGLPDEKQSLVVPMIKRRFSANGPQSLFLKTAMNDRQSPPALFLFNGGSRQASDPNYLKAEVPAANGVTNGRGLAYMYRPLSLGGRYGEAMLVDATSLERMSRVSMATRLDATLMMPTRFSLGFMKSIDNRYLKTNPPTDSAVLSENAFGHVGMGGSIGFADPVLGLSFGYAMNKMGDGILLNDRGQSLVNATYDSLGQGLGD